MSDEEMKKPMEIAIKESEEEPVKESVRESVDGYDALDEAVIDGTLSDIEIDVSQVKKHGGKGRRRK